jgi:PAS domain-containing protein
MDQGWIFAVVLTATSFSVATAALLVGHGLLRRLSGPAAPLWEGAETDDPVFLFDNDRLVDATDSARALLAAGPPTPGGTSDYAQLTACLASRFPDLARAMTGLAQAGRLRLAAARGEALVLHAEWRNGLARLSLENTGDDAAPVMVDRLSLRCAEEELALLRAITDASPVPIWRETEDGDIVWANRAYLDIVLAGLPDGNAHTWPLPRLFQSLAEGGDGTGSTRRLAATGDAAREHWFDVHFSTQESGMTAWALPADAIMRAEQRLREFTQTLTKTFAHLPIGLAVFDGRRRLQLFNPALTDLTRLEPEFLIARPSLEVFLDRLRDQQMIPEPQDYRGWRRELTELENAAASGRYEETWTLPSGQVFRVTGRPHPDGAVAFLFEDITAEVSLTRRFRAEIETGQDALDALEEAVAIFSSSGHMVLANKAYGSLWGIDPMRSVSQTGLPEAMRGWQARAGGGAHWARLRAAVGSGGQREVWSQILVFDDGTATRMRVVPVRRGTTMVCFQPLPPTDAAWTPLAAQGFNEPPAPLAASSASAGLAGERAHATSIMARGYDHPFQPSPSWPARREDATAAGDRSERSPAVGSAGPKPMADGLLSKPPEMAGQQTGAAITGAEIARDACDLPPFRSRLGPSRTGRTGV